MPGLGHPHMHARARACTRQGLEPSRWHFAHLPGKLPKNLKDFYGNLCKMPAGPAG